MPRSKDPTEPIRERAADFPEVAAGTSCNQSSFKAGKGSFLFIGPGAKGIGFKAMFKLDQSMPQARKLAAEEPDRFDVGSTGWVTARFSAERPLPKSIWQKWLQESYDICCRGGKAKKAATKKATKKQASTKKAVRTKVDRKKSVKPKVARKKVAKPKIVKRTTAVKTKPARKKASAKKKA
jgi:hypothetical protein